MMMTQSYYGGDFDSFSRSTHRAPTAAHYDRPVPYAHSYYDLPDYGARAGSRALIHEQGQDNQPPAHARRRIQVACSRCRRRKIKCTGDPGDGSGCSACRSAGADRNTCTFIRVGSHQVPVAGIDLMPASSSVAAATPTTATYGTDTTTSAYDAGLYQTHHRPSLPMLQTRSAYPEYDSYNASPAEDYTYASSTIQRQQSFPSSYGAENFRPWTSGSISTPVTSGSMYYEPGSAFSFGTLQVPAMPASRLPSVTGEAFSPLNMGSLHSSLPTQTVQERRLPMPYTQSYTQPSYSAAEVPQIRPLGSVSEGRMVINGIHSRNSMPWSFENSSIPPSSRHGSVSGLPAVQQQQPQHHGLPIPSSTASMADSTILGYQFSASSTSPEISPTSGPTLSESFSSTSASSTAGSSMPPPAHIRYSSNHSHHNTTESPRPSSARTAAASLYSFSAGVDTTDRSSTSDRHGSSDDSVLTATPQHNYMPPLRHPQPQHAASLDELRRRSAHDERAATAHRMSVSNLNGRY